MEARSIRLADHRNKETAFRKEAAPDDTPVVPGDGTEHNNLIAEAVGKSDSNSEFAAKRMPGFLDALREVGAVGFRLMRS